MNSGTGTEPDQTFNLTRSPYLNELIKAAAVVYYEPECPELYLDSLREKLNIMKNVARGLSDTHGRLKMIQERTPEIIEQNITIEENLYELWKELELFDSLFSTFSRENLSACLSQVKSTTEKLFIAFDRIKEEEHKFSNYYSPSPYFNELIRITSGVMRGDFPPEALKEHIEWMIGFWNHSFKEFTIYKTQRIDKEVQERLPAIQHAYEHCGEGLHRMMQYYEDGDLNHLSEGVGVVQGSSIVLFESFAFIQNALTQMPVDTTVTCYRCGTENKIEAKSCAQCLAIFPSYLELEQRPSIDLKVDDDVKPLNQRMITTNIQSLLEIVAGFNAEHGNMQDLKNILELLWGKVQESKVALEKMPVPQGIENQEEKLSLERSRSMIADAAQKMEATIKEMGAFFEDGDLKHLNRGLEMALIVNDIVVEVQRIGREIWEKYHPPG